MNHGTQNNINRANMNLVEQSQSAAGYQMNANLIQQNQLVMGHPMNNNMMNSQGGQIQMEIHTGMQDEMMKTQINQGDMQV